ncbi:cytochrome P450 [Streptomyces sp. AV19]|uniref:cytochrome P450 n=1 Tax=Streptomyces sp. AV19 TaxID=2793068 RepID=UPI0018FEE798|nr:cytochrome P450 [Streptomyces sp. AV19]MBH1937689.1 cytochrome P450 [Streptomyces sp. AV19]MDG4536357.1 cytochrome P450 [Streptomyces sp. AV19]
MLAVDDVPTAAGALPGVGHLPHLVRRRLRFLESLRRTGPIVRVLLGTAPVYVINDPVLVHQVQSAKGRSFGRGKQFQRMVPLLGHGVITSDGELYHRQRRTIQRAFTPDRIERHARAIHARAEKWCAGWEEGRPVDVLRELKDLATAVTAETFFSGRMPESVLARLGSVLPVVERAAVERPMMPKAVDRLPIPPIRRGNEAMARMRAVVREAVATCRGQGPRGTDDVVDCLLAARDPDTGRPLEDELVCDEVIAMLIGGVANIPTTLAWAWFRLTLRPGAEERLLTELAGLDGAVPSPAGLNRLPYTRAVMYEAMRLHSVQLVTQRTVADVDLGGVMLPSGTDTAYSPHALHTDPRFFPHPRVFSPERWLPDSGWKPARHSFVPFGGGRFKCIGDNFACAQMMATLAAVATHWRLLRPQGLRVGVSVREPIPSPSGLRLMPRRVG